VLNHIIIMGRLTRDPELRYTQSQIPVASFTVAVDRDYQQGGEKQTDFIECVSWRQGAEFVNKYFHKGSMIVVEGRLQSRKWQDRDGNNRTAWEILTEHTYFGESRRDDSQQGYAQGYGQQGYTGTTRSQNAASGQQSGYRQVDQAQNVYPGPEMNVMEGPGDGNPFTGREGQQRQAQQYSGQQAGMWVDINAEADGELPF